MGKSRPHNRVVALTRDAGIAGKPGFVQSFHAISKY
jgi:hypothetical protein